MARPVNPRIMSAPMAAAYIDLCASREALSAFPALFPGWENDPPMVERIRKLCEPILQLRAAWSDLCTIPGQRPPVPAGINAEVWDVAHEMGSCSICQQWFSDTFIAFVDIWDEHGPRPAKVHSLLATVSLFCLLALSQGLVVRGSVEIGLACILPPLGHTQGNMDESGDLYGPLLLRIHDMESKEAVYPRIVVGTELRRFAEESRSHYIRESGPMHPDAYYAQELSRMINQERIDDTDSWSLDYVAFVKTLHQERSPAVGNMDPHRLVDSALAHVQEQMLHISESGHLCLLAKISRLKAYLQRWSSRSDAVADGN